MFKPESQYSKDINYAEYNIKNAINEKAIIHGKAIKCDNKLNLYIRLGENITGIIDFSEFQSERNGATKTIAICKKVGSIVSAIPTHYEKKNSGIVVRLSRRAAQERCYNEYIDKLEPGDIIEASTTHIENFGVYCDVGCGCTMLLPVENIQIAKVSEPRDYLKEIKDLKVAVKYRDSLGRLVLTHRELLGTFKDEIVNFKTSDVVSGTVVDVQQYGAFVRLTPNLIGLAGIDGGVKVGDDVSVYINGISHSKMKVRLTIVGLAENEKTSSLPKFDYKIKEGKIDRWDYSPETSIKKILTVFK